MFKKKKIKKIRKKIFRKLKLVYKFILNNIKISFVVIKKWWIVMRQKCESNKYCKIGLKYFGKLIDCVSFVFKWFAKIIGWWWQKFVKWISPVLKKYKWLKPTRQFYRDLKKFFFPPKGSLPWNNLLKISFKNLTRGRSRTVVTMGGVGVGVGAIVLLVSFAYGLQEVITKRIIWTDALKVIDVTAESTSVRVDEEKINKIKKFNGVVEVSESVRLAGQVGFNDSKMDVVVVGADRQYLKLGNIKVLDGEGFTKKSDKRYSGDSQVDRLLAGENQEGDVAGISSSDIVKISDGDEVDGVKVKFKLRDGIYVPVFSETKKSNMVSGWVKGDLIKSFEGVYVWGSVYDDLSGLGRVLVDGVGIKGKWMKATLPISEKIDGTTYREVFDDKNRRLYREVYLTLEDVNELSKTEQQVDEMINGEGMVLGEVDGKNLATVSGTLLSNELLVGSDAARLAEKIVEEKSEVELSDEEIILKVWDESSGEVLINDAMLRAWDKNTDDILGKEIKLNYIVSGSVVTGVASRMFSEERNYKVVGVVEGGDKPIVFAPIGDLESLGINNYSSIKVLANSEDVVSEVRAKIQDLGLVTKSVSDTLVQINRLFGIIRFLLASFGSIALVVALFGMFNTMTVSLLERTREIGVMKSLGTSNLDVVRIFLAEAFLISLGGGIIGIVGGNIFGIFVDKFIFRFSSRIGQSMFVMPFGFVVLVFLVVIFVGLLTGWYPSKRASKISALNALRYE